MSYKCTEELFLKDVADHKMTVFRDDGVYRHIRFSKPGTGGMHFDLVTWPGYLSYSGDMGCYVFERTNDMFSFFRSGSDLEYRKNYPGRTLFPNLRYWSEKLQAVDGTRDNGSAKEFSNELFERAVLGDLIDWLRGHRRETTKDERRDLWDAVMSDVLGAESDSGGYRKQCAAHDFHHRVNGKAEFYFQDFFEHTVTDYTFRFVWCCYALAWGVAKYDEAKAIPALATANFPCGSMGEQVSA